MGREVRNYLQQNVTDGRKRDDETGCDGGPPSLGVLWKRERGRVQMNPILQHVQWRDVQGRLTVLARKGIYQFLNRY